MRKRLPGAMRTVTSGEEFFGWLTKSSVPSSPAPAQPPITLITRCA